MWPLAVMAYGSSGVPCGSIRAEAPSRLRDDRWTASGERARSENHCDET